MVGSDKERPRGLVGSGSDNARGSPILTVNECDAKQESKQMTSVIKSNISIDKCAVLHVMFFYEDDQVDHGVERVLGSGCLRLVSEERDGHSPQGTQPPGVIFTFTLLKR